VLVEGEAELCAATSADLHKSTFETNITEINTVKHEVHYMLENIDRLMAPTKVGTNLINLPGA
jgi:hypothetical protein